MSDDFVVDPLRDAEVGAHAKSQRRFLKIDRVERVDALMLEHVTEIWTVQGRKPFKFEVVADSDLPRDSGLTSYDGSRIVIQIPRRIRHKAFLGDGYARFTIGHELGHATLHLEKLKQGAALPRRMAGNVSPTWIPKFKSAEHQAMVFGAAFFINDDTARQLQSADDISVQAGVSQQAARIYFEQIQEELARPVSAPRVQEKASEARAILTPKTPMNYPSFLQELCSRCGQQKLFPVGHKFMCQACESVYDRFQDGDEVL